MGSFLDMLDNSKLDTTPESSEIRHKIFDLVKKYTKLSHNPASFVPGKSIVPVSGKVFDDEELQMLISSSLDFWLTTGRYNIEFEKQLSKFLNVSHVITTNSGSSANLLAITSLTSEELGTRALHSGDEVITVAAGFPTTVNPILQNNLVPVFVDVELSTYAVNINLIEDAITDKTKAIVLAHTLGNSFNLDKIMSLVKKYNLWLVEDCCDALGTTYNEKFVGTFGDISTLSFYPAHHITMGEGGAVFTNNNELKRIAESFRDWGRDCFCAPGKNNTCGKRFEWKYGELPYGYDHKYTYSNIGYNLKITDMQAAVGLAQLQKLPEFIKLRKKNFTFFKNHLSNLEKFLILPESTPNSDPSWFGFPITVKTDAPFSREDLVLFLSKKLIDTRPLFAGNITKQPYFKNQKYRIKGNLSNTDIIMNNSFWIGVYPGLTDEMLSYVAEQIQIFVNSFQSKQ
jgi:CDP-4-dehydro-6-deoxyglucose reductase, E1